MADFSEMPPDDFPNAVTEQKKKGWSLVWLVPVIAILVGAGLDAPGRQTVARRLRKWIGPLRGLLALFALGSLRGCFLPLLILPRFAGLGRACGHCLIFLSAGGRILGIGGFRLCRRSCRVRRGGLWGWLGLGRVLGNHAGHLLHARFRILPAPNHESHKK